MAHKIFVLTRWNYGDRYLELKATGVNFEIVDTTSHGGQWSGLSPFNLGPCPTYMAGVVAQNFENLWQFSKVYKQHLIFGHPSNEWYQWRAEGWANPKAIRYPMGKGAKPKFSHWNGENLDYVTARKKIYAPNYFANVIKTKSFADLRELHKTKDLILLDYDAYDHQAMGRTLKDVINDPARKCGHAFILMMILTGVLPDCTEF